MQRLAKFVTSIFYVGHSPYMPGTLGALAGLFIYFLVKNNCILYGFSIIFVFALGLIFSGEAEKIYNRKDARSIVIDEASGMLIALFLVPYHIFLVVIGFVVFRILDIIKPPPARGMEKLAGSWGVMGDDFIAALYTNILLQVISRVLPIFR